jgi:hypothetical protein
MDDIAARQSQSLQTPLTGSSRLKRSLPQISPAHARGLRRDLFRSFDRHAQTHAPRMQRALLNVRHPLLRSPRDLRAVLERACAAMRAGCNAYYANEDAVLGLLVAPTHVAHPDAGREEVLQLQLLALVRPGIRVLPYVVDCAVIGNHAVERMFERLGTHCIEEVREELLVACHWLLQLYRVLLRQGKGAEVLQLPVPTRRGVLLTERAPDSGRLNVRTFLLRGWDRRADASLACLERWAADPDRAAADAALHALYTQPENAWWFHAHVPRAGAMSRTRPAATSPGRAEQTALKSHSGHAGC